jgi:MYXO-CTERM domain-containing protein
MIIRASGIASVVLLVVAGVSPVWAAAAIDTAQQSGVKGYPIGIFGTGFGAVQGAGKVTILGAEATITKWTDTVIEAMVPAAAPATGQLVVTASDATTAQSPFEMYAIDPRFLARPSDLVNLAYKKPFVIVGAHNDWAGDPTMFLGYNDGSGGNDHAADFTVPFSLSTDLGSALNEDVWFSWVIIQGSDWYEGGALPADYTIDGSADSTDGKNGTWATLATVTGYKRKAKIDRVRLTGQRWIRMSVTAKYSTATTVNIAEIRVYKRKAPGGTGIDSIGILGDSITFGDHRETGPDTFYEHIQTGKKDGTVPAPFVMGMIGQSTGALAKASTDANSLAAAILLTPEVRYFGISLGTNLRTPMKQDFIDGVTQLLAANRVPILARMPDTDNSRGGYGTPDYKKSVLLAIDQVAAQYKLIPGPDFYTPFRQNLATYVSDGTHHTAAGGAVERQLWADTFLRSGIYSGVLAPPSDAGVGGSTGGGGSMGAGGSTGAGGSAGKGSADGGVGKGGAFASDSGFADDKDAGSSGAGGSSGASGVDDNVTPDGAESGSSCGCRVTGSRANAGLTLAVLGLALAALRRRRSRISR